jgi:hypothetical protein
MQNLLFSREKLLFFKVNQEKLSLDESLKIGKKEVKMSELERIKRQVLTDINNTVNSRISTIRENTPILKDCVARAYKKAAEHKKLPVPDWKNFSLGKVLDSYSKERMQALNLKLAVLSRARKEQEEKLEEEQEKTVELEELLDSLKEMSGYSGSLRQKALKHLLKFSSIGNYKNLRDSEKELEKEQEKQKKEQKKFDWLDKEVEKTEQEKEKMKDKLGKLKENYEKFKEKLTSLIARETGEEKAKKVVKSIIEKVEEGETKISKILTNDFLKDTDLIGKQKTSLKSLLTPILKTFIKTDPASALKVLENTWTEKFESYSEIFNKLQKVKTGEKVNLKLPNEKEGEYKVKKVEGKGETYKKEKIITLKKGEEEITINLKTGEITPPEKQIKKKQTKQPEKRGGQRKNNKRS